ncbi:MAG: gamma-glutamyltransferase family protein [Actinomycetota bacterium]|nr:gamma-glutamyltransferase family protein [Actinomycetota bacterium]
MPATIAVAATGQQALAAGLRVAADGGNAVDAALAAAMVAMATEPGIVSFLGGAFVSIWPVGADPVVYDGNVEMPGRGLDRNRFGQGVREVRTEYGGGLTMSAAAGSVATPGTIPAFALALSGHGGLDWARILEPAAAAARSGYPLSAASARYLSYVGESLFGDDAEARAVITAPCGRPLRRGEVTRNQALATTLDQLAADGPSLFSTGAVAQALAADMAEHQGLVTALDLARYQPIVRSAVVRQVGDWAIALNPPPSVGGPMLAVMLSELARRGGRWTWRDVIEIQRTVLSHRLGVHDLSRDLTADGYALLEAVERHGLAGLPTSASTANISAVDSDGLACAVTMSSGYHSGTCVPGTGLLLNNALGEVELNPHGLHGLEPGTRLASNMAPTTGRTADGRALAIGSPGADRITTALMLVLGQGCLHGTDLRTAVDAPRLHARVHGDVVTIEYERDPQIASAIAELGLASREYPEPHMYFGGVGAAYRHASGGLDAAGDARREAAVGVSADSGHS